MIYLTYNDPPSGIYHSQVIDVVNYMDHLKPKTVKLIALISLRKFFANKQKITTRCRHAMVLPMVPKAAYWHLNFYLLALVLLFHKDRTIMARGPFATNLALRLRQFGFCKKVIFDARGAYHAELNEYNVVNNESLKQQIKALEQKALDKSDFRLAVSGALVSYWQESYGYKKDKHVVIPCTLSNDFGVFFPTREQIEERRREMGYDADEIIFIYSGSSAGWQSFALVDDMMCAYLKNPKAKLIVLSDHFDASFQVMQHFKEKVSVRFVEPSKVKDFLFVSDYGILYREQSVTNQVASPVKFAEYLNAGLKVIISENLGDYTDFASFEDLNIDPASPGPVPYTEKIRIHTLSLACYTKERFKEHYMELLNV
jgi:hypothetical protein